MDPFPFPPGPDISLQTELNWREHKGEQHRHYPDPENGSWEEDTKLGHVLFRVQKQSREEMLWRGQGLIFYSIFSDNKRTGVMWQQRHFVLNVMKTCMVLSFLGFLSFQKSLKAYSTVRWQTRWRRHDPATCSFLATFPHLWQAPSLSQVTERGTCLALTHSNPELIHFLISRFMEEEKTTKADSLYGFLWISHTSLAILLWAQFLLFLYAYSILQHNILLKQASDRHLGDGPKQWILMFLSQKALGCLAGAPIGWVIWGG